MDKIELIKFEESIINFKLMHKWCSEEYVYEWFEQRILSYDEIVKKYKNKLKSNTQTLFLIEYNGCLIGYTQIYKYTDKIYNELKYLNDIYEYDIFIGEKDYLSKGIGSKVIDYINKYIFNNLKADAIVLRPFKRNTRAVKCYEKNSFCVIHEYEGYDTLGNKEKMLVMLNKKKI